CTRLARAPPLLASVHAAPRVVRTTPAGRGALRRRPAARGMRLRAVWRACAAERAEAGECRRRRDRTPSASPAEVGGTSPRHCVASRPRYQRCCGGSTPMRPARIREAERLYDTTADKWVRDEPRMMSDFVARPSILEECRPKAAGGDCLDLGCGEGYFTRMLARAGARSIVGSDV